MSLINTQVKPFTANAFHNGKFIQLSEADLKGRPHLIFFGFTHCPDVCPTKLFEVSEVLSRLGPEAGKVGAYFVTVDPERDTPEKLKEIAEQPVVLGDALQHYLPETGLHTG